MKKVFTLLFLINFCVNQSFGQFVTSNDNAGNYSSWSNTNNNGVGFAAWNMWIVGSAGFFLGNSDLQGFGNINTENKAFGMYGNPTGDNYSNAQRLVNNWANGAVFSVDIAVAYRDGNKGIDIFASGYENVWNFNVGNGQYTTGGVNQTSWIYSQTSVFTLTVTQNGADMVISLTRGSDNYSTTISGKDFYGFKFYCGSTGTGDLNNLYFNNLKVEYADPEKVPSTANVEIRGAVDLAADKTLTVNDLAISSGNFLTLKSTSSGTGSLITNGTVTGNITAQRYIPGYSKGATGFHLLSSPVSGQLISPGFVNVVSISATTDFYYFNEEHNYWINIKNSSGTYNRGDTWQNFSNDANPAFIVGKGYLVGYSVAPDPTLEFSGVPNTGNLASGSGIPALTYTEGVGKGWNLVGNPYPSAIDWDHAEWVKTNINGSVYVYEGSSGNYISWNGTAGGLTNGIIPAMQGFFVKAEAVSPALTIPNNARVASSSNLYKSSYDAVADNVLVVSCESQGLSDQLYLQFDDEATVNYDSRLDAYKLMGTGNSPQIYSTADDRLLSISALPLFFDEMAIPVHVKVVVSGLHTLTLPINTLLNSQQVYLEDTKENTVVKLTATDSYSFIGETTDSPSRFKLTFSGVGLDSPVTTDPQTIFTYGNQLFIQNPGTALVEIYTFAGQLVARQNVNESGLWSQPLHLSAGQYVVRVVNGSFAKTAKVVLF